MGHGGSCPGYRSQLLLRPEEKIAVAVAANAMVDAGGLAQGVYDIVAPVLAAKAPDKPDPDLSAYVGTYTGQPWTGESAIVAWEDGLADLSLPTDDPVTGLTKLRKTGEHTFRRVRKEWRPRRNGGRSRWAPTGRRRGWRGGRIAGRGFAERVDRLIVSSSHCLMSSSIVTASHIHSSSRPTR